MRRISAIPEDAALVILTTNRQTPLFHARQIHPTRPNAPAYFSYENAVAKTHHSGGGPLARVLNSALEVLALRPKAVVDGDLAFDLRVMRDDARAAAARDDAPPAAPATSKTDRIYRAMLAYYSVNKPDDQNTVTELLTELRHYCDEYAVDFNAAIDASATAYTATAEDLQDTEDDDAPESGADLTECQNCGTQRPEGELKPVEDLLQRVAPGEPLPVGECPDCGAVCHPVKQGESC